MVFCNSRIEEYLRVDTEKQVEAATLVGLNFFVQPAAGVRCRIASFADLLVSVGYKWSPTGNLHLKGNADIKSTNRLDWSGVRTNAGIVTYFKTK